MPFQLLILDVILSRQIAFPVHRLLMSVKHDRFTYDKPLCLSILVNGYIYFPAACALQLIKVQDRVIGNRCLKRASRFVASARRGWGAGLSLSVFKICFLVLRSF